MLKHYKTFGFNRMLFFPIVATQFLARRLPGIIATSVVLGGANISGGAAQSVSSNVSPVEAAIKCVWSRGDIPEDIRFRFCQQGAEAGDPKAQVKLATFYLEGQVAPKDFSRAAAWARKAAEQGEVDAQGMMATMYRGGIGVAQDYTQSMLWARKAAAQNAASGQYSIGLLYGNGWGVKQDWRESARWHRLAAEQGHNDAQAILGSYYELGRGVPRDHSLALQWMKKAAAQGSESATKFLQLRRLAT